MKLNSLNKIIFNMMMKSIIINKLIIIRQNNNKLRIFKRIKRKINRLKMK